MIAGDDASQDTQMIVTHSVASLAAHRDPPQGEPSTAHQSTSSTNPLAAPSTAFLAVHQAAPSTAPLAALSTPFRPGHQAAPFTASLAVPTASLDVLTASLAVPSASPATDRAPILAAHPSARQAALPTDPRVGVLAHGASSHGGNNFSSGLGSGGEKRNGGRKRQRSSLDDNNVESSRWYKSQRRNQLALSRLEAENLMADNRRIRAEELKQLAEMTFWEQKARREARMEKLQRGIEASSPSPPLPSRLHLLQFSPKPSVRELFPSDSSDDDK